ncbi:MFS transporter [Bombilactobacillus thymidiniphilus]|uniref:MFS transporter n=1 Tax=Bombilactobacillus thymidiniphilus TaxID=2923363 RepID=A0ABY4PD65_9LACO|nr:MFS transporter [Bombilactobacillus thymidiniphilus]UQS83520.1 MFS transporter [Bombilactobacillus thymidiniphilus]
MQQRVPWSTKLAILSAGLLSFVGILVETSMNVTFPNLMREFHVNLATIQWVTTGYLLLVTLVMSTTSYLIKRFTARKLFITATLMCLIGTLVCASAHNFVLLMIGRLLEAVATGLSTPTLFHIIMSKVPTNKMGTYTGFATMVTSFAPALGPTYGGIVNNYVSWRWIFIGVLPLIVLIMITGGLTINVKVQSMQQKFDWLGLLSLAPTLIILVMSFDQAGAHGFWSWEFGLFLVITLICAGLFSWHLKVGKNQLLNFKILQNPIIANRAVNFFILQFMNIGISFVIPILSEQVLGTNSMVAGLILLPGSLLGALVAPIAGNLYDHYDAFVPLSISNCSLIIGSLLFAIWTHQLNLILIVFFYCFMRGGFNLGYGNTMSDASKYVDVMTKPDVNSLFNTLQQYAGSLGTGILSAIISTKQLVAPTGQFKLFTTKGCQLDFWLLVLLSLIALMTTLISQHYRKKQAFN